MLSLLDEYMVSVDTDRVNFYIGTHAMETTPVAGAHRTNLNLNQPALKGNTCPGF